MSAFREFAERVESLLSLALTRATAALDAALNPTSSAGYDVVVDETLINIPADGAFKTIASYDLTAVSRAAYIEFQWVVQDEVTLGISTRRQGQAFQGTGGVGAVDNISNLKNNIAAPPSFLFQVLGTILVIQISNPLGANLISARGVMKIQFNPKLI